MVGTGFLQISSNSVTFETGATSSYLYEVTYPFTRDDLACLNNIDSQDPDAYVRVLKQKKRCQSRNTKVSPQVRNPQVTSFQNTMNCIVEEP